jgi:sRNA-binding protein
VLQRLFELYPQMFGARFRPLKLGVFQELMARHPDEFKKEDLKLALGLHARSTRYLESMAAGEKRHDLNGEPVEDVAPEHVHHAIVEVFRRRQARSREDMRAWLRERLVRAVEASGLPRQEYAERFRGTDLPIAEVLDEAVAEVGERAARREALRRAFEASGRTPAEFAEMYGVELAVVRRALADPVVRLTAPAGSAGTDPPALEGAPDVVADEPEGSPVMQAPSETASPSEDPTTVTEPAAGAGETRP